MAHRRYADNVRDQPVVAFRIARVVSPRAPSFSASDSLHGAWVLVVARRDDGGFVSTPAMIGGRIVSRCADRDVREYVLDASVPEAFAGAGVFDLAGRVVGFVARCDSRLVALPVAEVARLMATRDSSAVVLWERLGVEARPLNAAVRAYFGVDTGLLVTAVRDGAPVDHAGLGPGDIVAEIDGVPVDSALPPAVFGSLATADSHTLMIRRATSRRTTRLSISTQTSGLAESQTSFGIQLGGATAGVEIGRVQPGSLASRAGVRPGDRLLRVGRVPVMSATAGRRALAGLDVTDSLTFIVLARKLKAARLTFATSGSSPRNRVC